MLSHIYYILHTPRGLDSVFPEVNLNRSWAFVALLSWMVQARALDEAMVEHWRYIEAEVQKLPTDNPNFDVDLKPHDIDGPLIHCKSELESMDLIDHLIEIFTRGYALADATSRIAYIDAALDQIPQLGLFQRLELKAAAVSPFPEWTLGGLRQSSCRTLVPLEFVAGASRELLMGIVRERGGAGVSGGPGVPW